jgi:hypothetical protein
MILQVAVYRQRAAQVSYKIRMRNLPVNCYRVFVEWRLRIQILFQVDRSGFRRTPNICNSKKDSFLLQEKRIHVRNNRY